MTEEARTIVGKLRCAETELKEVGAAYFEEDDFGSAAALIESMSAQLDQVTREWDAAKDINVPTQPKWISVKDDTKPRHGKEYLCVCTLPDDTEHEWDWIMVLRWYGNGGNGYVDRPHFTDEGVNGMTVTHWMPLPEPPKEDE